MLEFAADTKIDCDLTGVDYMTLLQSPEDPYQLKKHPFRKFRIQDWDLNQDNNEEMLTFWTQVGPTMTHLSLDRCTFERAEDFQQILFELTPSLESLVLYQSKFKFDRPSQQAIRLDPTRKEHLKPENAQKNMKNLFVRLQPQDDDDDYDDDAAACWSILPITWIELFAHFPNIEQVMLTDLTNEEGRATDELVECVHSMEIIRDTLGSGYFANLKELYIHDA